MNTNNNSAVQAKLQQKFADFKAKTDAHFAAFEQELMSLVKLEMKNIEQSVVNREEKELEKLLNEELIMV